ncbi:MAGE-like protein 2 [Dasypus novemcinctus]|uniref:MAGE-like protein 2 n=1 Tax=Dasypus novemcinctus TaxID=9361 RepID=UPI0026603DCF|nr:uncharacterized protein LOC101426423 [Dasypus novemcinctus]
MSRRVNAEQTLAETQAVTVTQLSPHRDTEQGSGFASSAFTGTQHTPSCDHKDGLRMTAGCWHDGDPPPPTAEGPAAALRHWQLRGHLLGKPPTASPGLSWPLVRSPPTQAEAPAAPPAPPALLCLEGLERARVSSGVTAAQRPAGSVHSRGAGWTPRSAQGTWPRLELRLRRQRTAQPAPPGAPGGDPRAAARVRATRPDTPPPLSHSGTRARASAAGRSWTTSSHRRPCACAPPRRLLQREPRTPGLATWAAGHGESQPRAPDTCPLPARWAHHPQTSGPSQDALGPGAPDCLPGCSQCNVTLELCVPGNHCSVLFSAKGPGDFSHEGWRLQVGGQGARLVIEHARASQAGTYRWHLEGLQRSVLHTWLNVSATTPAATPAPAATTPAATASGSLGVAYQARTQRTWQVDVERTRPVAVALAVLAAAVVGVCVLALWGRHRSLRRHQQPHAPPSPDAEVLSLQNPLAEPTWQSPPGGAHPKEPTWRSPPGGAHPAEPTRRSPPGGAHPEEPTWRSPPGRPHLEEPTWRSPPGGAHLEEPTWRSPPGGIHLEEPTWRSPPGGAHLEEPTRRSPPGGAHPEEPTWRTPPGGAHLEEPTWGSPPGGAHLAEPTWRSPPGGAHLAEPTWKSPPGGTHLEEPTWRLPPQPWKPSGTLASSCDHSPCPQPTVPAPAGRASLQHCPSATGGQAAPEQTPPAPSVPAPASWGS